MIVKEVLCYQIIYEKRTDKMERIAHSSHIKAKLHDPIICEQSNLHVYYQV